MKLKYNSNWALVTGGFNHPYGKEICLQLAKQRLNLILIGKDANMNELANELEKTCGIETSIVDCDLSFGNSDCLDYDFEETIAGVLKDKNCKILVNFVGTASNECT